MNNYNLWHIRYLGRLLYFFHVLVSPAGVFVDVHVRERD